jgi:hypothetical protein
MEFRWVHRRRFLRSMQPPFQRNKYARVPIRENFQGGVCAERPALDPTGGVRVKAAVLLGMSRRSFRHCAKKHGL